MSGLWVGVTLYHSTIYLGSGGPFLRVVGRGEILL